MRIASYIRLSVMKTIAINLAVFAATFVGTTAYAQRFTIQCNETSSHDHKIEALFNTPKVTKEQVMNAFGEAGLFILIVPRPELWTIDEEKKTVSADNIADFRITSATADQIEANFGSPDLSINTHFSLSRISGKLKIYTILSENRAAEWRKKNKGALPIFWMWTMECAKAKPKF